MDMKEFEKAKKQHEEAKKRVGDKIMKLLKVVNDIKELDDDQMDELGKLVFGRETQIIDNDELFIKGVEEGLKISQKESEK